MGISVTNRVLINGRISSVSATTVPDAPTGLSATATDTAVVTFSAPLNNGGSAITGYTVVSVPAGGVDSNAGTTNLSHTITGLTSGVSYTFYAYATNVVGNSANSASSNSVTPIAADPYYSDVILLLHGDGTNGSTTVVDNSPSPKTFTATGDAQITTSIKKYGTGSWAFDGAGDYLTTNTAGTLGSGNFTVEMFVNTNTLTTEQTFFSYSNSGLTQSRFAMQFRGTTNDKLRFLLVNDSNVTVYDFDSTITVSATVWNHVAYVVNGTTATIYINGVASGTQEPLNTRGTSNSTFCNIGWLAPVNPRYTNGYMDEIRVTKGIARYTADFTPPTAAFPNY